MKCSVLNCSTVLTAPILLLDVAGDQLCLQVSIITHRIPVDHLSGYFVSEMFSIREAIDKLKYILSK